MASKRHNIDPSELATAFADDEITEKEREQFEELRQQYPYLDKLVESELAIKKLLSERLSREKAPTSFKEKIKDKLKEEELQKDVSPSSQVNGEQGIADINYTGKDRSISSGNETEDQNKFYKYLAIAASVLILSGFGYFSLNQQSDDITSLEQYTYKHFTEQSNIPSDIKQDFQDLNDAEQYIRSSIKLNMTVPNISSAKFKGVGITEFIPGYRTPYLIYNQPDIGETIYIFTFNVSELSDHSELKRNDEAVETCIKQKDYFVENVEGKHVVSWKWNDTWYAAISNHNGNNLAALVEPLN